MTGLGEGHPAEGRGNRPTRTAARRLAGLASLLTVAFGVLLALTVHLAGGTAYRPPGPEPSQFITQTPPRSQPPTTGPHSNVVSPGATATVTVTVTAEPTTSQAVPAAQPSPKTLQAAARPTPTVTVYAISAPTTAGGSGSGWEDIAAAGTGLSGFAAVAAAIAAFVALRRPQPAPQRAAARGNRRAGRKR